MPYEGDAIVLDYRDEAPVGGGFVYCPRCAGPLLHHPDPVNGRIRPVCERCGWTYFAANLIGVLVVVEADGGIVMIHPSSGTPGAPASLPGGLVEYAETPEAAAIRLVREQTGLQIELLDELTRFLQKGTPFGPVLDFGFVAQASGADLRTDGDEGPAVIYPLQDLPAIIPARVANQCVLDAYLARHRL